MNYLERLVRRARLQGSPLGPAMALDPFAQEAPWAMEASEASRSPVAPAPLPFPVSAPHRDPLESVAPGSHPLSSDTSPLLTPSIKLDEPISIQASLRPQSQVQAPAESLPEARMVTRDAQDPLAQADAFMQSLDVLRLPVVKAGQTQTQVPGMPPGINPPPKPSSPTSKAHIVPSRDPLVSAAPQPRVFPKSETQGRPVPVLPDRPERPVRHAQVSPPPAVLPVASAPPPTPSQILHPPSPTLVAVPMPMSNLGNPRLGAGLPHLGLGQL